MASCKKEQIAATQAETSDQLLVKVTKTEDFGDGVISTNYAYNDAGMLIAEGNKRYERDYKQRIIRILEPRTLTNRTDIQVYYKDDNSNEVLYTFCKLVNTLGTDSVVYLHDKDGKLVKTMSYFRDLSANALSDVANLVQYHLFNYDADGNLLQWDDYKVQVGFDSQCGSYSFNYYDKKRNPLYTRTMK